MSTVPASLTAASDFELPIDLRETEGLRRVLFFDGVCGLCSQAVDFVLKRDPEGVFQFSPLQGETARTLLTPADLEDLNSMVLWVEGRSYRKSAAAVRVLWQLGPGWQLIGTLLWLIPLPLRNLAYSLVAANRYRIFGKKETCRLPTLDERARFLP
jgi:predicted DCC family thiol-disulfide oxidoreductase YuxK